eukprot:TRINITY_DN1793_c0_g4_i1.p1 TRINITY_DN1793_c0_g4~~TRINITY_DN1793_c0_g4_i1.p1  ORF type:complete len:305 (-),score=64.73 TRINITY_DN1793_c0_g4_i1:220-1134(-)
MLRSCRCSSALVLASLLSLASAASTASQSALRGLRVRNTIPSCLPSQQDLDPRHESFVQGNGSRGAPASADVFDDIYERKAWGEHGGTLSGAGSHQRSTRTACRVLAAAILARLSEQGSDGRVRVLDAPVGDFHWQPPCLQRIAKELPEGVHVDFYGVDIAATAVERAEARRTEFQVALEKANVHVHKFRQVDLLDRDGLRTALKGAKLDVILSNDALMHNTGANIWKILANFNSLSGGYFVVNSYVGAPDNRDIETGAFRRLDLTSFPFELHPQCGDEEEIWQGNTFDKGEYILMYALPMSLQ